MIEFAKNLFRSSPEDFIKYAYMIFLGRCPDEKGMSHYMNKLSDGALRFSVLVDILESKEYLSLDRARLTSFENVVACYRAVDSRLRYLRWVGFFGEDFELIFDKLADGYFAELAGIYSAFDDELKFCLLQSQRQTGRLALGDDYDLIENSGFFDREYYLERYADIRDAHLDPLVHYIKVGWREGRDPSPLFSTSGYLADNPDVAGVGKQPLLHYLTDGAKEGRRARAVVFQPILSCFDLVAPHCPRSPSFSSTIIDVLIPVFNGVEYLPPLFESLIKDAGLKFRVFLIDDCSTDPRVFDLLCEFRDSNPNIYIHVSRNDKNIGFVSTVNKLVAASTNSFVLLNTDTEVPPGWLYRLMLPILMDSNVASTTPFTNSGTIFSFPDYLKDNAIYRGMSVSDVDAYFKMVSLDDTVFDVPTGVGFCMGINREVVDNIGMFDPVFGRGYSEENDWCMRAVAVGYRHVHVTNLFVYHKHGGSFSTSEKSALQKRNHEILLSRYPSYPQLVSECVSLDKSRNVRGLIKRVIDRDFVFSDSVNNKSDLGGVDVFYVGHIASHSGVGQAARGNISALSKLNPNLYQYDLSDPSWLNCFFADFDRLLPAVVVFHLTAAELVSLVQSHSDRLSKLPLLSHVIGVWAWEFQAPSTDFSLAAAYLSEIWAISTYTLPAFSSLPPKKSVINHVVEENQLGSESIDGLMKIRESYDFLVGYIFDLNSYHFRKNPLGVINSFKKAFGEGGREALILKIGSAEKNKKDFDEIKRACDGYSNIFIFTDRWSASGVNYFYDVIDVYLALFRAEGFGLTIAEAMIKGVPVICSKYSGVIDFVGDGVIPVSYSEIEIPENWGPYRKGWICADPNIDEAATALQNLRASSDFGKQIGLLGASEVTRRLSSNSVAQMMMGSFKNIANEGCRS